MLKGGLFARSFKRRTVSSSGADMAGFRVKATGFLEISGFPDKKTCFPGRRAWGLLLKISGRYPEIPVTEGSRSVVPLVDLTISGYIKLVILIIQVKISASLLINNDLRRGRI
jgi:hypothetical protein